MNSLRMVNSNCNLVIVMFGLVIDDATLERRFDRRELRLEL